MIKATEFRIGNLITNDESEIIEVTGIVGNNKTATIYNKRGFEVVTFHEDYITVYGIPLTEEWLLKFGFEKREKKLAFDCDEYYHPDTMLFSVAEVYPSHRLRAIRNLDKTHIIIRQRLDYVHELQNLYFALTGEELTIKEPVG